MLMDAILKLHEQIKAAPLGVNRERIARESEAAALTAKPTAQMKGLLR
jgi:NADH-quinone oxidoreductase subunit B